MKVRITHITIASYLAQQQANTLDPEATILCIADDGRRLSEVLIPTPAKDTVFLVDGRDIYRVIGKLPTP